MDGILPFADGEEEMLQRLHRLFTRFREYNVTLNPEKCAIGMNRVEYVGHLIDAEGMHLTYTKLDSIARFEEQKTMFEVKHFLGHANYFRDQSHTNPIPYGMLQIILKHSLHPHDHVKRPCYLLQNGRNCTITSL
jgi:hypothetical protein